MNKNNDFQAYLEVQLKDPIIKKHFDEYGKQLEIAYKILKLRKQKRISQIELAKKIGTTQSNIARVESGKQNLTINLLQKITTALHGNLRIDF